MAEGNQTVVYLSEQVVVLGSCALSFAGSSLIILTYILWSDLRTTPRRLLVYLSVADWLSAVSYAYGVWRVFRTDSLDCVAQGAISTFANTSSFFWTVAIAVYLYLFIVRSSQRVADSLVWLFHLVSWGVPLAITVAAVCLNKIGYDASEVSVGWCWVSIHAPDRVLWMLLTGKIWEFLAYLTLPVLYILIKRHIHIAESPNATMVENEEPGKPVERKGRLTVVLVLATLISAFGSSFQYGYNVAVINSPSPFMQQFYNTTYMERYGSPMEENLLTLLWSLSVSMYPLGGFFGSLMVAPLVNKLGRKGTLLFNNIFSIVPAVMMGVSEIARSYEIIIVARFIVGICAGLSSNVVPMYLGELAPKNLRGALGIIPQLFITIGILSAQVLGIRHILGNTTGWTLMLGVTGIPALIELLLLPFFPESPRYMLIQRGDEKTAKKALQRLRGMEDVDAELSEMRLEDQSERAEGRLSVLSLLSQRSLRWQLISIIVMNMGQQLSGVNAIYYYADSIYATAGVEQNDIQYVTVGTGAVNVFMTIAAVFIVEASGRRLLLLCGFGICCVSCVLLTVALNFQDSVTWMSYISISCVIIYVIGHAIGPSPIPYVVTTEMFRQSARPAAFMVAGSVHWLCNFTVGLVFPFLERGLGSYSFIIFSFICLVTLIYIWLVVPETKNKTFLEICRMFAKRNKVEIKLGDGDLPLKESKESLEDAGRVTAF